MTNTSEDAVTTAQSALDAAREVLAGLESKQAELTNETAALLSKREEIALNAFSSDAVAPKKKLADLNDKLKALKVDQEGLLSALARAKQKVVAATAKLDALIAKQNGEAIMRLAAEHSKIGDECDELFVAAHEKLARAKEIRDAVKKLGGKVPDWTRVKIDIVAAMKTVELNFIPIRSVNEAPRPYLRRNFSVTLQNWSKGFLTLDQRNAMMTDKEAA